MTNERTDNKLNRERRKTIIDLVIETSVADEVFSYSFIIDKSRETIILSKFLADKLQVDQYLTKENNETISTMIHPDDQLKVNNGIEEMKNGILREMSLNARIRLGKSFKNSIMKLNAFEVDDEIVIIGLILADSQVRENEAFWRSIEDELKKAELVNRLVIEGAADYIYHMDLINDRCTFSPHALEVLPLEHATFDNALQTCLSFIVPEDRQVFIDTMGPFLAGQSQYHNAEYRVNTNQGDIMWISCRGKGIHDEHGTPLMIAGSLLDITEKKKYEKHMERLVITDQLTGLYNRYKFNLDMKRLIDSQSENRGAVVFIDLDSFKVFNDLFGHNFGDKILLDIAELLKESFPKQVDLYRIGGDEFVVHWQNAQQDELSATIDRLNKRMKKELIVEGKALYITLSMGIAIYPEHGNSAEEILKKADIAMYAVKRDGKNKIGLYLDTNYEEISRQFVLETELRQAVEQNFEGFSLCYQPIVSIEDGRWIGAEALLRWKSPTLGMIPANEVIYVLEYVGLMVTVGEWILSQAIGQCAKWRSMGMDFTINVNLSVIQIDDPMLKKHILDTLDFYQLPSKNLCLEITEGTIIKNLCHAMEFCKEMQNNGIKIALDDFGTGYSSLSYLRKIPLDEIKIDKSFLDNFEEDAYNRAIVSSLCDLAHTIQLKVCVEGIEEEKHWSILKKMNVDMLQGYFFSKPLSSQEFSEQCCSRDKDK